MKVFLSFARQAFHTTVIYQFDFWLRVANTFIMMYSAYWLWTRLYTQQSNAFDISVEQMVTYGVLAMIMDTALRPGNWVQYYIYEQMKNGAISMDLLKPLDFHMHMLARNAGETLFYVTVLGVPSFLVGHFFLGLHLPSSLGNGLLFLGSLLLGYLVLFSLSFLLGMVSIYTLDIRSIGWAYNSLVRFFSGQWIPLWLFPLFLAQVAGVLPFQCIFAIPLSIYIGKLSAAEMSQALMLQSFWVLALVFAGRLLWWRARNYLVVQGG